MANQDPNLAYEYSVAEFLQKIYKHINSLQVYGDFANLYPIYGSSEINQAFSRMASVRGCITVIHPQFEFSYAGEENNYTVKVEQKG